MSLFLSSETIALSPNQQTCGDAFISSKTNNSQNKNKNNVWCTHAAALNHHSPFEFWSVCYPEFGTATFCTIHSKKRCGNTSNHNKNNNNYETTTLTLPPSHQRPATTNSALWLPPVWVSSSFNGRIVVPCVVYNNNNNIDLLCFTVSLEDGEIDDGQSGNNDGPPVSSISIHPTPSSSSSTYHIPTLSRRFDLLHRMATANNGTVRQSTDVCVVPLTTSSSSSTGNVVFMSVCLKTEKVLGLIKSDDQSVLLCTSPKWAVCAAAPTSVDDDGTIGQTLLSLSPIDAALGSQTATTTSSSSRLVKAIQQKKSVNVQHQQQQQRTLSVPGRVVQATPFTMTRFLVLSLQRHETSEIPRLYLLSADSSNASLEPISMDDMFPSVIVTSASSSSLPSGVSGFSRLSLFHLGQIHTTSVNPVISQTIVMCDHHANVCIIGRLSSSSLMLLTAVESGIFPGLEIAYISTKVPSSISTLAITSAAQPNAAALVIHTNDKTYITEMKTSSSEKK
eukprot:PhM_4_TR18622/c0_g1_i2/m.27207